MSFFLEKSGDRQPQNPVWGGLVDDVARYSAFIHLW